MNLISCGRCGVVLDKGKLKFPEMWDDKGERIEGNSIWYYDTGNYSSFVPCPVCEAPIFQESTQ